MENKENMKQEHIKPEQMLNYLANYIIKQFELDASSESLAQLLGIYFRYSNNDISIPISTRKKNK